MNKQYTIREAEAGDEGLILDQLLGLATYENIKDELLATEASIRSDYFEKQLIHALFVEDETRVLAFATWYTVYATFNGISGIFIEDLFVSPDFRRQGIASAILAYLQEWGKKEGCSYLQWFVLDWNTNAQTFYKQFGGKPHDGWQIYRKPIR